MHARAPIETPPSGCLPSRHPRLEHILPQVYDELRAVARRYLRGRAPDELLQPTALIHEAYLRLVKLVGPGVSDRSQLIALVACAMRSILVDLARRAAAQKRGAGGRRIQLTTIGPVDERPMDLLVLEEVLAQLAKIDEHLVQIVELRFFGGFSEGEVAEALGVSVRTVERDWRTARAWLRRQFQPERTCER